MSSGPRTWRIVVPVDPIRLGHNARLAKDPRVAHQMRVRMTRNDVSAGRTMWQAAGRPTASGPVRVSVIYRRCNPLDQANVWDGLKAAMDGLFNQALTPNDSDQWVHLGEVRFEERDRPEVEFIIEEIP